MKRRSYTVRSQRRKRHKKTGPNFGKLYKEKKENRLLGFFLVLFISLGVGVGAYALADYHLDKKESQPEHKETPPAVSVTPEATGTPTPQPEQPERTGDVYPDGFMSDFTDTRVWTEAKGIYVNTSYLGRGDYATIDELIALLDETELNAMVIDIKDDTGNILFDSKNPVIDEIGAEVVRIADLPEFVAKLKEHGIYCIARIVTFKDQVATRKLPEAAVKNQDGTIYVDGDGERWLNPYSKEAWDYLVGIAKEAAEAGFDEINFDYLRTSSSSSLASAYFGEIPEGMTRMDAITEFVKYACQELKPLGVFVSGDVFATIINSTGDGSRIGQSYVELSRYLDYICPMAYPSHYNFGYGGLQYPDKKPFQLMLMEMKASVKKLSVIPEGEHCAKVRPWLQDFTASYLGAGRYMVYDAQAIRAQISAVYSAGYEQWLLWNAGMSYTEDALLRDKDR